MLITTGRAADLCGVHESTVKRWCDGGELPHEVTRGGHRRIGPRHLAALISREGLALAVFGDRLRDYLEAEELRHQEDDFEALARLAYYWALGGDGRSLLAMLDHQLQAAAAGPFLDGVVAGVMARVDQAYHEGRMGIADEHAVSYLLRDLVVARTVALPHTLGPRALVTCARGEGHELGALMARLVLRRLGWQVHYLGLNVPPEDIASAQLDYRADLVCVSITLAPVIPEIRQVGLSLERIAGQAPFRLAFGGAGLDAVSGDSLPCRPALFSAMTRFESWAKEISQAMPPRQSAGDSLT
ncbi:MAG: cobalamin-dependent protein [Rhodothermales bacterium]|nr:cobalamin-dependent protein [Rhodothermales bacterium]MBO6780323.1 cobalamin-dependent protein [Rhodothermales bacterium]